MNSEIPLGCVEFLCEASVRKGLVVLIATNIYLVLTTWRDTVVRLYMH